MTLNEAELVAEVCSTADFNCEFCVRRITKELQTKFPQFEWVYNATRNLIQVSGRREPASAVATSD